ncbi:MAG: hypothetical protein WBD28_12175 [Candidatus Zixiibacteriota bacterium]
MLLDYNPEEVVPELFEAAKKISKERFILALLDVARICDPRGNVLIFGDERGFALDEFCRLFNTILKGSFSVERDKDFFVTKLHLLAYSQFWDCRSIQRMLSSLARIARGERYDADLYLKNAPLTWKIMEILQDDADRAGIKLGSFLRQVYRNQIRNAFVHSEYCFLSGKLSLLNYDKNKKWTIPSITADDWDQIYKAFKAFCNTLFHRRSQELDEFKKESPFIIKSSDFKRPKFKELRINYDTNRKRWDFA